MAGWQKDVSHVKFHVADVWQKYGSNVVHHVADVTASRVSDHGGAVPGAAAPHAHGGAGTRRDEALHADPELQFFPWSVRAQPTGSDDVRSRAVSCRGGGQAAPRFKRRIHPNFYLRRSHATTPSSRSWYSRGAKSAPMTFRVE